MTFAVLRKANRLVLVAAIALALALRGTPGQAQSTNQAMNYAAMASAIAAGTFINSNPGSCVFTGYQTTTYAIFDTCIQNNGSSGGSPNELTYGAMVACRTLYTRETLSATLATGSGATNSGTTVTINDGAHAVTWSWTMTTSGRCSAQLKVGGAVLGGSSGSASSSYAAGGLTGTIAFSIVETGGGTCTSSGSITYYH